MAYRTLEKRREYYARNKDRINEQRRKRREQDPTARERHRENNRKYIKNNRKKVKEQQKKWREENKEKTRAYGQAYYYKNKSKLYTLQKEYRKNSEKWKESHRIGQKRRNKQIRELVLKHYGGKCACCGEKNKEFLVIDHINGGGEKERKRLKTRAGSGFYRYIIKKNYPDQYRLLCHNCNMSLGLYGYCPHKRKTG